MTIVEGQIESLKKLKANLNENDITRFNSIGDIKKFLKDYNTEKHEILVDAENAIELEIKELKSELERLQTIYDALKIKITSELKDKIQELVNKHDKLKAKSKKNFVFRIFYFPRVIFLNRKQGSLRKKTEKIVLQKTCKSKKDLDDAKNKLDYLTKNKSGLIQERISPKYQELSFIKKIIEGLNPLIAGAIGENLVVKELEKIKKNYVLLNDFSMEFDSPIYNRKEDDRIYSIQIDHLLITNSGIFILETKNWSKKSIESFDLRSPIKQIRRTSFALFVLLNSDSGYNIIDLNSHHWGKKQIPIRNIVVMINQKPKEKFKYVNVKLLDELNRYIQYFDPIFDDEEVIKISDYLKDRMN
jgi:hypothetical protein